MAETKRPGKELDPLLQGQDSGFSGTRGKTIKDLSASECAGSLKLIHILQRTLLMQLKKRIELEKNRVQGAGFRGQERIGDRNQKTEDRRLKTTD